MPGINQGQRYGLHKEIQQYLDKIDKLQEELKPLLDKKAEAIAKIEEESKLTSALREEKRLLERTISSLNSEVDSRQDDKERLEDRISELSDEENSLLASISAFKSKIGEYSGLKAGFEKDIEILEKNKEEVLDKLDDARSRVAQEKIELSETQKRIKQGEELVKKLNIEVNTLAEHGELLRKENQDYKLGLDEYKNKLNIYAERLNKHFKSLGIKIKPYGEN